MSILSTVLKAKFKKQPIMVVSFDPSYGFPEAKTRYCSKEQFSDAALFLMGKSHEYGRKAFINSRSAQSVRKSHPRKAQSKKKENSVHKFFRILFARERVAEFPMPHQMS